MTVVPNDTFPLGPPTIKKTPMVSPTVVSARKTSPLFLFLHPIKTGLHRIASLSRKTKLIVCGIIVFTLAAGLGWMLRDVPSPTKMRDSLNYAISSKIFDRNGNLLYEIYADKNRTPIAIKDLPPYVYQASVSIEDQNFYKHNGFDFTGMARAVINTVFKKQLQGGSTITQQLVKTALLTPQRTVTRKIKEAVLTVATEIIYKKDEILEMYLNNIPYGGTSWGIEAAAQTYFDKHAKDLSLAEAALLAGLPQSPSRYSPFGSNPQLAKDRQTQVLRRMVEDKYITQAQADDASKQPLVYAPNRTDIKAPHFVQYVKDILVDHYGEATVETGGLRVTTTLDLSLQTDAQASVAAEINKLKNYRVGNGAALVTKPDTGEILAMVGSRDFYDATHDGQVNITTRTRQPGSSIKPLNIVTAFQLKKMTPGSMMLDVPTCFMVGGQDPYCPKNYDGNFHGPVQTRFFLGNSFNIPEVKVLAQDTIPTFIATASAMGITTWDDPSHYGLSLTLGGGEVRMVDMAEAFGVMANEGVKIPLQSILKVEDFQGNVLEQYDPQAAHDAIVHLTANPELKDFNTFTRVLDRQPTYLVSHILLDNGARAGAFGENSKLVVKNQTVSVKTGTTNDLKDNWTIGYTPSYLTAVWVGNNDNTPMNQALVSGITGAAPIWNDIMTTVLKGKKAEWPEEPPNIVSKQICVLSGLLPNPAYPCQTRNEFFWQGTQPTMMEDIQKDTWINPQTGLPPKPGDSTDGLVSEHHTLLSDPFVQDYCIDCVRPVDPATGKVIQEQYTADLQQYYANYGMRNQQVLNAAPVGGASPTPDQGQPQPQ
ncbi:MAG TPA: transglycosylase domain-containing protein [Candidatus Saccharimonadia bacterium]|nr:transglycosylase domain-containing protein [Candidatus Saccharimonadia bacterium]